MKSSFYAYLSRLRWIKRWGLKRNAHEENVMEHSWEVSVIAHTLALIKNRYFDASQLYDKIKIPVYNNSEQSPLFKAVGKTGDEGGQFVFIKK